MIALHLLFGLLILIDLAAIALVFLLGLAAAGSTHDSPFSVFLYIVVLPGLCLTFAIGLYVFSRSTPLRLFALLLAASPALYIGFITLQGKLWRASYVDSAGTRVHYRSGKLRDLEYAILNNDLARTRALLPEVNINEPGEDGTTLLSVALRQMDKNPQQLDFVRALLTAGANPNLGDGEKPLSTALYNSRKTGPAPVLLLLDSGASLMEKNKFSPEPIFLTLAGRGIHPDIFSLVLARGIDIHYTSPSGKSLLSEAVQVENWPVAIELLKRGATHPTALAKAERSHLTRPDQPGLAEVLSLLRKH